LPGCVHHARLPPGPASRAPAAPPAGGGRNAPPAPGGRTAALRRGRTRNLAHRGGPSTGKETAMHRFWIRVSAPIGPHRPDCFGGSSVAACADVVQ
jgi:hypothetical protein